jgi:type IV fimbrial biogenesis protein FimT
MRALPHHARGVTLVEMIISVAIAAILSGLAVPAMHGVLRRQRVNTSFRSLVESIHATRMLSIERQRRALLCPSRDGRHCSGDSGWEHGWLVALDSNHDGQPDAQPQIVHAAQHGVHIQASRGRSRIYYHPDGSAPGSNLTLRVCPVTDIPARVDAVVISNVGRVRITRVDATPCPRAP